MIDTTLGHYRITGRLGEGGMGEVYRAVDQKLGREVAIKVLPPEVAGDPDRLSRFEREARTLASVNHPNIAAIHGLEEADGRPFLAMELVEGEDLSERIRRGPLPIGEAVAIATQIAAALEAAHERGIVHRDLKPGNIRLTPDDQVKVLDFGLAKAFAGEGPESSTDLSLSPTLSLQATRAGVLLGTAAYMSPEQARGKRVDRQTDVWAFGCVVYEMLTGRRAFGGESVADVLAAVLEREPDWQRVPAAIQPVLRRCLARPKGERFRDAGDVAMLLSAALDPPGDTLPQTDSGRRFWQMVSAGLGLALLAIAAVSWLGPDREPPRPSPAVRFYVEAPPGLELVRNLRVSPDGTRLFFRGHGSSTVYLHDLATLETRSVPGTEGTVDLFVSPDGEWLGFANGGKMRKVSLAGGYPSVICDVQPNAPGADWGDDGTILFSREWNGGLWRVAAEGGEPVQVTEPDPGRDESGHWWPDLLPGARSALFTVVGGHGLPDARVAILDLEGHGHEVLFRGAKPQYLASGHVLFFRDGAYFTVPFDLERREVDGEPRRIPLPIRPLDPNGDIENFVDVSTSGVLASVAGNSVATAPASRLVWSSRDGQLSPLPLAGNHDGFSLSPDGRRLAVAVYDAGSFRVLAYDLELGSQQLLSDEAGGFAPVWHPDRGEILYTRMTDGIYQLYRVAVGTGSAPRPFLVSASDKNDFDWAPDGRAGVLTAWSGETGRDLWAYREGEQPELQPILTRSADDWAARISPDGRWVAFESDDGLQVAPWPGLERLLQLAPRADAFRWSPTSDELFYVVDDTLWSLPYEGASEGFSPGRPSAVGTLPERAALPLFEVSPDGRRFLFAVHQDEPVPDRIEVTLDGFELLQATSAR